LDKGHEQLIADLEAVLAEAKEYQFHDFRNRKYALPKIALNNSLGKIAARCQEGEYDNEVP
jgi:hypothetical protein